MLRLVGIWRNLIACVVLRWSYNKRFSNVVRSTYGLEKVRNSNSVMRKGEGGWKEGKKKLNILHKWSQMQNELTNIKIKLLNPLWLLVRQSLLCVWLLVFGVGMLFDISVRLTNDWEKVRVAWTREWVLCCAKKLYLPCFVSGLIGRYYSGEFSRELRHTSLDFINSVYGLKPEFNSITYN